MLSNNLDIFRTNNIKLLSISSDSARNMRNLKQKHAFQITFISDPRAGIAKKYEVSMYEQLGETQLKTLQALPSKFLINKSGIIRWKYLAKSLRDRPTIEILKKGINKIG